MKRFVAISFSVFALFVAGAAFSAAPDVKKKIVEEHKIGGAAGKVLGFFGGNKPTYTVEYYKKKQFRSDKVNKKGKPISSIFYDLNRRVIVNADWKKGFYTEMEIDAWREFVSNRMSGAFNREDMQRPEPATQGEQDQEKPDVKWKFEMNSEKTGNTKNVAGGPAEEVVLKLKVEADVEAEDEETGETVKAKGGLKVTSYNWVSKAAAGPEKEISEFRLNLAKEFGNVPDDVDFSEMMSQIMESNEQLGEAMERLAEEGKNFDGPIVGSETVYETWGESNQPEAQAQQQEKPKMPKFGGKLLKKFGGNKDKDGENSGKLLTTKMSVLGYETSPISDDVFTAYLKLKKKEIEMPSQQ